MYTCNCSNVHITKCVHVMYIMNMYMYIYIAEVHLYTQIYPYDDTTKVEFDPDLGHHDAFLMVDRYIFVQVRNYHLSINIFIYLSCMCVCIHTSTKY